MNRISRPRVLGISAAVAFVVIATVGPRALATAAQPRTPGAAQAAPPHDQIPVPDLDAKLSRLTPTDPVAYFRLAEEVGEEVTTPGARDLARRLYVLAFHLDASAAQPLGVAHSAALGLASLTRNQPERRWLRALAAQVDPSEPDPAARLARLRADPDAIPERTALQIASALGFIRAAEGRRALRLLDRPAPSGLWPIIEAHEGILGGPGEARRLRGLAERWPTCPECHNRRVLVSRSGSGAQATQTTTLCPVCNGAPGPRLSDAELIGHLRLEAALLRGVQRTWSAQLLSDGGEPLRDPNPADLAIMYRVDPDAVLWRHGRWEHDPARPARQTTRPASPPAPAANPPDPAAPATAPGGPVPSSG